MPFYLKSVIMDVAYWFPFGNTLLMQNIRSLVRTLRSWIMFSYSDLIFLYSQSLRTSMTMRVNL